MTLPRESQEDGRDAVSENSRLTLKIVITLCSALVGGVAWVLIQTYQIREDTGKALDERLEKYVSRDLFNATMEGVRRENSLRFDALERSLSELRLATSGVRSDPDRR